MIFKYLALWAAAIFLSLTSLMAQQKKIDFTEYDLKNGLHVILHQDNSTPIVAVTVMYHVGSKNDRPDRRGFAHFFEHLMFEGSDNIKRHEFPKYVENSGGVCNANTTGDRTYYYEILPSNQLEMGLWLESERMMHAKVDSVGIKTQKAVVIEEKKQNYDNRPYGSILIEASKRAFSVHSYRWTTIGSEEDIRAAKDQDFVDFYKLFYVPNNAVLTITGDIKIDETKKLIDKYFSEIPKGKTAIPRPDINAEPPLKKEIRDTIYDNIQLPAVIQAYRIPAMGTDDYYAVDMLATLISTGQSSRMYKSLVDVKQKALQVASFSLPYEHPGMNLIFGIPNMSVNPKDLEAAMDSEILKVRTELISDREFKKLQNQTESEFVNNNASIESRANNLATSYTYYKNTNYINTEINNYLKVTKEDIKRVANKYFVKENRVVLYYLPKSQKK